jgi:hypothetical protein
MIDMCGGFGSLDGDANFTRMNAALDLSVRDFQRSFYTYERPFCQMPVLRRCIPENQRVGGLLMRIGDANFTQLKAPLDLSIRRFCRVFYTYRRPFWEVTVVRRCFLEDRQVWMLGQFGWRCEFHLIECTLEPIDMALSAKLTYV